MACIKFATYIWPTINNLKIYTMYTLSIYNRPSNEIRSFEFTNIRQALNAFIERCDELGYTYEEDNDGGFIAGGLGYDNEITLTSNF